VASFAALSAGGAAKAGLVVAVVALTAVVVVDGRTRF
jgi:hypothetical protein